MESRGNGRRALVGCGSFVAGAVVLCLLSTIQKLAINASLHWTGYVAPLVIGGCVGCFIGLRQMRLKTVTEELRRSLLRYRVLFESAPDGVAVLDRHGRIIECSESEAALWGVPKDALVGRHVTDSMTPESAEAYRNALSRLERGGPAEHEAEIQHTDGGIRHVWRKTIPLTDSSGRFGGSLEFSRDATERKRLEAEYRKESDFCTSAITSLPGILYVFDDRGRFIRWNKSLESDTGYSAAEIAAMNPLDFVVERERSAALEAIEEVFNNGCATAEVTLLARDGRELCYFHTCVRTEIAGQRCLVGVGIDITKRKQAEEESRQLEAKMQHAQKLESLGVLAGGIAHDFNNLLVGILGHAGLAMQDTAADSHIADALRQIEIAARRAAELANQMLAYAGKGHFRVESLDINSLVEEMAHLLKASVSKKATLKLDLADAVPRVNADATQIRQVVMNLITNASDALGDGEGTISLRTSIEQVRGDESPDTYFGQDLKPGKYVAIEVRDTGQGMDRDTLTKVFDPFYTTKQGGRGLGLASVIGIVRGHRGGLRVVTKPGRGTSFTVCLPQDVSMAARPVSFPAQEHSTMQTSPTESEKTVLVADDEDVVRSVAKMSLERSGFTVITACDGADAVRVFSENAERISAVLLDMAMPHLSGEEVFAALREQKPELPILLCSGYDEQDAAGHLEGDRHAAFIQKPYSPRELVAKLSTLVSP